MTLLSAHLGGYRDSRPDLPYQRYSAIPAHMASTTPKGQAPWRKQYA